jgi:hypothetical protein
MVMCSLANGHGRDIVMSGTAIVEVLSHFESGAMGESARCEERGYSLALFGTRASSFYS